MTMPDLLIRHATVVRNACLYYAQVFNTDADDLQQEVSLKLLRFPESYTPTYSFRTFVSRVAKNICIDMFRRKNISKNAHTPIPIEKAHGAMDIYLADDWTSRQLMARIYSEIRRKYGSKKAVMMYMAVQGYKFEEISEHLGMRLGTVKGSMHIIRNWMELKFRSLV